MDADEPTSKSAKPKPTKESRANATTKQELPSAARKAEWTVYSCGGNHIIRLDSREITWMTPIRFI